MVERILKAVWWTGLAVIPFVWCPAAVIPYEIPKVWLVQRWVEVLMVLTLVNWKNLPVKKLNKQIFWMMMGWLTVVVIGSGLGVDPLKSWVGNYWRGDGLITLVHLAGLAIVTGLWWDKAWEKITLQAILVSLAGTIIWGGGTLIFHREAAAGLGFGQPKFLAGWLLVTGVLADRLIHKWGRMVWLGAVVIIGSTWSWMTLALAVLYTTTWKKYLLIIGVILVGIMGIYWWPTQHVRFVGSDGVVAFESRERIFTKMILGWKKRPFLGWGWANADYVFEAVDWPLKIDHDVYVDKAHSTALEILATTGIIGLGIYLVWVVLIGKTVWRTGWIWPLGAYLIHSQTNVTSIAEEVIFWLIVGVAMSGQVKKDG